MLNRAARVQYLVTASLAAMVLLHFVSFWHARRLIAQRYADFTAFYAAGLIVRSGMGHQIYDLELQTKVERGPIGRSSEIPPLPFLRPGYEALAFVPFSFLAYLAAFAAWNSLTLLLLWVWTRLARGQLETLRGFSPVLWMLAVLGFFPVFLNLPMGQDAIPFLLLVTLAFFKLRNNDGFGAGAWLGSAAFKPQIVLPLVIILLFRPQRGRFLSGFLLVSLIAVLISAALGGWESILRYPEYLLDLNRKLGSGTIIPSDMPNLRGLTSWFGTSGTSGTVTGMASALVVALAGRTWLQNFRDHLDFDSAFSISIVAALLVSYHSHVYDLALLILPISLRLDLLLKQRSLRRHAAELGLLALLFFTPLYLALVGQGAANLLALLLLLFAFSIVISAGDRERANTSPSMGR